MFNQNFTVVIPNLNLQALLQEYGDKQQLRALKTLLNRAKKSSIAHKTFNNTLAYLFGYVQATSLPIAAIEALGAGIKANDAYWLRVDPIQIQVEYKGVYLLGNSALALSNNEVEQLTTELNELLQLEGLHLYIPLPHQWYLALAEDPQITTHPLPQLIGKELSPYLPYGAKAKYWRKLLTELQMLVHGSKVNQQRQAQGLPLIGGVWFWGEGKLPMLAPSVWKKLWTNNLLAKGFAGLGGVMTTPLPLSFNECLMSLQEEGDYLVVLDDADAAQYDQQAWLALLQQWEQQWFAPILLALKTKKIASCTFYTTDGAVFKLNRRSLWAWWRRFLFHK